MRLCVERGSHLGFGNRFGMRKIGRNIVRRKDATRVGYGYVHTGMYIYVHIWLRTYIRKLGKQWRSLIRVVMVVSCLELPNKGLDVVEASCLKDKRWGSESKCE